MQNYYEVFEIRFIDNKNEYNLFNAIDYSMLHFLILVPCVADFVCHRFFAADNNMHRLLIQWNTIE